MICRRRIEQKNSLLPVVPTSIVSVLQLLLIQVVLQVIPLLLISLVPSTTTTSTIIATSNDFYFFASAFTTAPSTTSSIHSVHSLSPKNTQHSFTLSRIRTTSPTRTTTTTTTTTTATSISTSTVRRNLSFFLDTPNWDDIVYQTESLGNALASFSLQQSPPSTDVTDMMIHNNHMNTPYGSTTGSHNNILLAFPVMYLAGLLTSFSPCVWGLLPLTISYISTAANERSDQRTLLPTIAFATGLAAVFCTMGMITVFTVGTVFGGGGGAAASLSGITTTTTSNMIMNTNGSTGSNAMAYTTTMILPILSNLVCFIMGLKLLELIDIALPSFTFLDPQIMFSSTSSLSSSASMNKKGGEGPILLDATGRQISSTKDTILSTTFGIDDDNNNSANHEQRQKKETSKDNNALFRTFLLGGSSALVASPCATPVLTSILAYVANTMAITDSSSSVLNTIVSTLIGGLLLFGYTLGYSTPLLVVAATGGQALVRLKQQNQDVDEPIGAKQSISSFFYSIPNRIAPWVTPITGGILLYLGTTGLLVNLMGDPSLSGLTIIE